MLDFEKSIDKYSNRWPNSMLSETNSTDIYNSNKAIETDSNTHIDDFKSYSLNPPLPQPLPNHKYISHV